MTRLKSTLFTLMLVSGVFATRAEAATITPSAPTANDLIRARIDYFTPGACGTSVATVVSGNTVQTTISIFSCFLGAGPGPAREFVLFGPLPAGTYTYEVYTKYENFAPELLSTQSIVVSAAPPPIPALDTVGLLLLMASLAALGLVSVGRP